MPSPRATRLVENAYRRFGFVRIAGVDEVGRGCLAGPVLAAAVVLDPAHHVAGLRDSKLLSALARDARYADIVARAAGWSVAAAEPAEIDEANIHRASLRAMRSAVLGLEPLPDLVLVDAFTIPDLPIPQRGIVGGDRRCASIAAASIVAKVTRDRLMHRLHEADPRYGFDRHKGYGTADHLEALGRYGYSAAHRRSFRPPSLFDTIECTLRTDCPGDTLATDREQRLRKAEALVRQGRLEDAVAEYESVLAAQPADLASQNALGDLLVRLGRTGEAASRFMRVADHHLREGFFARAAGFYKKVLKIEDRHEAALLNLAEASIGQGLIVEARRALAEVATCRRHLGDARGADEILQRLAEFDPPAAATEPRADRPLPDLDRQGLVGDDPVSTVDASGADDGRSADEAPANEGPGEGSALEATTSAVGERARPERGDPGTPHLALGRTYRAAGMRAEAEQAFTLAARDPACRFDACVSMAELQEEFGDIARATDWYEHAIEAPTPGVDQRLHAFYRLGDLLDASGERARALAVWLELQALSPGYRDVSHRVAGAAGGGASFTP